MNDPQTFRRRPAEIRAVQWTDTNADALAAFAGQRFMTVDPEDRIDDPDATASLRESAHECWSLLRPGDWVVKRDTDFAVLRPEAFADLYAPAVSSAVSATTTPADRVADRERVAETLAVADGWRFGNGIEFAHMSNALTGHYRGLADAVLAVLPPPADRAATRAEWDSLGREADRLRKDWVEMRARAERVEAEVKQLRADRAAVLREAADAVAALDRRKIQRYADTIRDAWEEGRDEAEDLLRRLAAETAGPETQTVGWHLTPATLDLFVRALVNEVDYDIHKGYECGEEDGEDHYPELVTEAAEMLNAITAAVPAGQTDEEA